jgi:hypothetical protein
MQATSSNMFSLSILKTVTAIYLCRKTKQNKDRILLYYKASKPENRGKFTRAIIVLRRRNSFIDARSAEG